MTMTELIGTLERKGWRFRYDEGEVRVRTPKPRPGNARIVLDELHARRREAIGFLRARDDAQRTMAVFSLPEIPVYADTPPPDSVVPFPEPAVAEAPSRGRAAGV